MRHVAPVTSATDAAAAVTAIRSRDRLPASVGPTCLLSIWQPASAHSLQAMAAVATTSGGLA